MDNLGGLKDDLLDFEPGSAPGVGNMRPEYLIAKGKLLQEEDMDRFQVHGLNTLNYPDWYHRAVVDGITVPLQQEDKLHPLGIAPCLMIVLDRMAVKQNKAASTW